MSVPYRKCQHLVATLVLLLIAATPDRVAGHGASDTPHDCTAREKPIIGIVLVPTTKLMAGRGDMYLADAMLQYVEMAGARAVPIRLGEPADYYRYIVRRVNGLLFPGAGQRSDRGHMARVQPLLFKEAMKMNDEGINFPILGTCHGFNTFMHIIAQKNISIIASLKNTSMPEELHPGYEKSRIFRALPQRLWKILATENITAHNHHNCMPKHIFDKHPALRSFFRIISTTTHPSGVVCLSTIEAYKYPFLAMTWHPEKHQFFWKPNELVNHSAESIEIGQHIGNFFIREAKKNCNKFPTREIEQYYIGKPYMTIYTRLTGVQNHMFNYRTCQEYWAKILEYFLQKCWRTCNELCVPYKTAKL